VVCVVCGVSVCLFFMRLSWVIRQIRCVESISFVAVMLYGTLKENIRSVKKKE
jgi:hypothetical protein